MNRAHFSTLIAVGLYCFSSAPAQPYSISTVAGGGLPVNIPGVSASLSNPAGIAVDNNGNAFIADAQENVVLRLDATTGVLSLVAGNGTTGYSGDNGAATAAQINQPEGVALDAAGNLYIADFGNNVVRKVSNGVITTVAGNGTKGYSGDGGPATSAQFRAPWGVAVDTAGNLYISDFASAVVRRVSGGVITTIAGNGTQGLGGDGGAAISAQLQSPEGLAVDSTGSVYIADSGNYRIRKISDGVISTVVGNTQYGTFDIPEGVGGATGARTTLYTHGALSRIPPGTECAASHAVIKGKHKHPNGRIRGSSFGCGETSCQHVYFRASLQVWQYRAHSQYCSATHAHHYVTNVTTYEAGHRVGETWYYI